MSATPETDVFFFRTDIQWDDEVAFARKLERERNEARSERQAGYEKAARAEAMLRTAAGAADKWRERAEALATSLRAMGDLPDYAEYALSQFAAVTEGRVETSARSDLSRRHISTEDSK
ncbi:MAG: hypothetical protein FGM15_12705 [Chthoniobacterales bacterium]|nr:hypothetical protein [Chthoniobacterales bacterium]